MPIDLDLQVLSTTSWTVQLQTGSQEVRGFESLRLHQKPQVNGGIAKRLSSSVPTAGHRLVTALEQAGHQFGRSDVERRH